MEAAPAAAGRGRRKHKCRYGDTCRLQGNAAHTARFWHPGDAAPGAGDDGAALCPPCRPSAPTGDLSQDGDQHAGTKFPRMQCQYHPGCKNRWTCWYSHGLIHAADDAGIESADGVYTCFLGQAPHNQGCMNPTWNGEPFDFCSKECREMAKLTPKGPLSCRRHNCPCPVTVNGMAGQFCCKICYDGKPCKHPTHVAPTAHLVVVAKPQKGKYAPCAREDCACSVEGGSSWDGKPGQYCCRACRNGTPCTKLWHTEPESERSVSAKEAYVGFVCAMDGCEEPTWNGREGEYCCFDHRHMAMGNYVAPADDDSEGGPAKTEAQRLLEKVDVPSKIPFPNFAELWRHAFSWAHSHSAGAHKGKVAKVWFNESLASVGCPSRISFEKAVKASGCDDFRRGEFGWHGTKSIEAINGICWSNLDTARRSGQACGPGEYFSRGTQSGLNYSEGYAGGTAGNLLIVFWIMSHELGGAPTNPAANGAGLPPGSTNHIVVQNPTHDGRRSTGVMYCVPCAVVAFGSVASIPDFRTFNPQMKDPDVANLLKQVQEKHNEKQAAQNDKAFIQAEQLMLKKSEALLKNALEGTDVEALQDAIAQVQKHVLVDTSLLDKAQTMVGPKCRQQLEAASSFGSDPHSLQKAINVADKLTASGGIVIDKAVLQHARDRLPFLKAEYQIRIALDTGDAAALRGGIRSALAVEGFDLKILQDACQSLVDKTEERLRNAMEGTDVDELQKVIRQAERIQDSLPKTFDDTESNWEPTEGMPHIDDSLIEEARKKLIVTKYENGLRIVIKQVADGSAPPIKLSQTMNNAAEIEGISEELLGQARELMVTMCDKALQDTKASGDTSEMLSAVVLSLGIPDVNSELFDEVKQSIMESSEGKIQEAEARLNNACDRTSALAVQGALQNASQVHRSIQKLLQIAEGSALHQELQDRLVIDETLLAKATGRRAILIYQEVLEDLISKVKSRSQHVENLKFWVDQSATMEALADVDPELISRSQAAISESCEKQLREALVSDSIVNALTALSWCDGIDGLDEALLETVRQLITSRCQEMLGEREEGLRALSAGGDLASLESAIQDAQRLPDMLPSDPNLSYGVRARVSMAASSETQKAILEATKPGDAIPKTWDFNDGCPRILEDLLRDTRSKLLVDKVLLNDALQRVDILKKEASLNEAAAGDDLAAMLEAIASAEAAGLADFNQELLTQVKSVLVRKGEEQLQAACEAGDVLALKAKLDQVGSIPGVNDAALEGARETMVKTCENELRTSLSATDPARVQQSLTLAEAIPGVDVGLLKDARARIEVLNAESQLDAACKAGDVPSLKTALERALQVPGVSASALDSAKQLALQTCENQMRTAMAGENAALLRQNIDQGAALEVSLGGSALNPELMEEARKRLDVLEKPKSMCCTIV